MWTVTLQEYLKPIIKGTKVSGGITIYIKSKSTIDGTLVDNQPPISITNHTTSLDSSNENQHSVNDTEFNISLSSSIDSNFMNPFESLNNSNSTSSEIIPLRNDSEESSYATAGSSLPQSQSQSQSQSQPESLASQSSQNRSSTPQIIRSEDHEFIEPRESQSKLHISAIADADKEDFTSNEKIFRSQKILKFPRGRCVIDVSRDQIFETSYASLMSLPPKKLRKRKLQLTFAGENGVDIGGVSKDFFHSISQVIFNPDFGLFEYASSENYRLQINPDPGNKFTEIDRLSHFRFVGRIIGLCMFHHNYLNVSFVESLYKQLAGAPVSISDLKINDIQFYNSLMYILNNDDVEDLELNFSVDKMKSGKSKIIDLIDNGRNVLVTNKNKDLYVELMTEWKLTKICHNFTKQLLKGFHEVIPESALNSVNGPQLEYIICGTAEIDIIDWKENTILYKYKETDDVYRWFWMCMESWNMEQRAKVLQFTTGSTRLPVTGFKDLPAGKGHHKFTIQKTSKVRELPRSHVCFNTLVLPSYSSYKELCDKLELAVQETEGFGRW